jgi:YVTN family beta-propeller protein
VKRAIAKLLSAFVAATTLAIGPWAGMSPANAFDGSVDLSVIGGRVFPTCVTVAGGYAYVTSSTGPLAIVRVSDGEVMGSLDVGSNASVAVQANGKIFVTAVDSNTVTVIDATTRLVAATIANNGTTPTGGSLIPGTVGSPFGKPIDIAVGTVGGRQYLFVSNIDGDMAVIDAQTNLVVSKVSASGSWGIFVDGNYAYLPVRGGNLSVMDITKAVNDPTNAALPSVTLPAGSDAVNGTAANGYLYVNNFAGNSVLLINQALVISNPNTAYVSSLTVGVNPFYSVLIEGQIYVSNLGGDSISMIDAVSREVTSTLTPIDLDQPGCVTGDSGTLYITSGQNALLLGIQGSFPPADSSSATPAVRETLFLAGSNLGATCVGGNPNGFTGTWVTLPSADQCRPTSTSVKPGATLLGWSTSAIFPVARAQAQTDKKWGAIDDVIDGVRMIFIPAGMATFLSGSNTLYPVWSA